MRRWLSFDTDRGAVLWGILCCWLAVAENLLLLRIGVSIFWIVPLDLFFVPLAVSLALWLLRGAYGKVE